MSLTTPSASRLGGGTNRPTAPNSSLGWAITLPGGQVGRVDACDERGGEQEEVGRANERVQAMHRRKNQLQARHWETWAAVKQAVDSTDPEGLLRMGCSDDEYDDVVVDLTGMVLGNVDVTMPALMAWFMDRYGSEASPDAVMDLVGAIAAIQARISADS